MNELLLLSTIIACLSAVLIDLLLIILWFSGNGIYKNATQFTPQVSILLAARNEEKSILRCLESLINIDYPKSQLEILVGDDNSEDNTFEIAKAFAVHHSHLTVHAIENNLGNARGKANVLAHLARKAKGDIFFITDADIAVPASWINGMLRAHQPNVGIATGVTGIQDDFFQHADWIFALGMVKVLTDLGQPVTAMGNNMYVTREAYEAVGGYESLPFSITEDFELFKQVRKRSYNIVQLFQQDVLAVSKPTRGIKAILNQRKRWMTGAVQLPWPIVTVLTLQALYYPGIVGLFLLSIKTGVIIFLLKVLLQAFFIASLQKRLGQKANWALLLMYEVYAFGLSLASSVYFLIPVKITWKGRKY